MPWALWDLIIVDYDHTTGCTGDCLENIYVAWNSTVLYPPTELDRRRLEAWGDAAGLPGASVRLGARQLQDTNLEKIGDLGDDSHLLVRWTYIVQAHVSWSRMQFGRSKSSSILVGCHGDGRTGVANGHMFGKLNGEGHASST